MEPPSFADLFTAGVRAAATPPRRLDAGECRSSDGAPCGLCHAMTLTYETEARLKAEAATLFWSSVAGDVPLAPLVPSPRGRGYRTVSKRKAFKQQGGLRLGLIGPADNPRPAGISVGHCAIEPEEHAVIYRNLEEHLRNRDPLPLVELLQYAIIKGNYREQTILFNVRAITPALVRAANGISRDLTGQFGKSIAGVFLFEGDPNGRYYLAPRDAGAVPEVRKVFGKNLLFLRIGEKPFLYPPMTFSQVNESLLESFVAGARTLLSPSGAETLYDLYCGYGLFGLSLAPLVRRVIGAETSHLAVAAAAENARRQKVSHARFVRALLSAESAATVTTRSPANTLMLLDPPRSGTTPGVIEALAGRHPQRVVHVFCNMEVLSRELLHWRKAGYQLERGIPFDMFPGTPELEMMVLLTPAPRAGR
jgi:tRNA/tmRNA/rRNA uracil-C5-methylase (TrmA/RlmC/RlmD family)